MPLDERLAPPAPFGARLAALREAAGFDRGGLARRAGISWDHLKILEKDGTLPRASTLAWLAGALGVTMDEVWGGAADAREAAAEFEAARGPAGTTKGGGSTPGGRVVLLRTERGLTQSGLARKAGLTPSTVGKVELDAGGPSAETLARVAAALGVTMDYLWLGKKPGGGGPLDRPD